MTKSLILNPMRGSLTNAPLYVDLEPDKLKLWGLSWELYLTGEERKAFAHVLNSFVASMRTEDIACQWDDDELRITMKGARGWRFSRRMVREQMVTFAEDVLAS